MSWLRKILSEGNTWVATLATTNFKIVVAATLDYLTAAFYAGSEVHCHYSQACRPIDSTNFGLWLGYLAGLHGFALAQYLGKRKTYSSPSPDSERADVPSNPAPSLPSPQPVTQTGPVG